MTESGAKEPVLEARQVTKIYRLGRLFKRRQVVAINGLDLKLYPGCTTALFGPSGSGKSTLGRCLAGFEKPDSGEILYRNEKMVGQGSRKIQMLMQDVAASIPWGFNVFETVAEPLEIAGISRADQRRRVHAVLGQVGLAVDLSEQRAHALSGGQLRRLVLARALLAEPEVLILDEAFSGLDLAMCAQITNLLLDLQERFDLAYLLISHERRFASWLADERLYLESGRWGER